jgi:hypothetical protein
MAKLKISRVCIRGCRQTVLRAAAGIPPVVNFFEWKLRYPATSRQ